MKRLWLFRSNIKNLEYYHQYTDLDEFETKCHDFYLLFPIWLLRNDYFEEVTIWRLTNKPRPDIIFNIEGKLYYQRWVRDFSQAMKFPHPKVSLFRGGFPEYDKLVKKWSNKLGIKMYLGTGKRIYPQYGGEYDVYLQEDKKDFREGMNCMPFWKTASPHIFNPKHDIIYNNYWDICWPCNFTQIRQKGQEEFIKTISKSSFLKQLRIVHCGNKPEVGQRLCQKYGIDNIEFLGSKTRDELCNTLNSSKFGMCMSNREDGCPRIVSEMLMTETPIFLSEKTRLLDLYKKNGVVEVTSENMEFRIKWALEHYDDFKREIEFAVENTISFDKICQKNINRWEAELKI